MYLSVRDYPSHLEKLPKGNKIMGYITTEAVKVIRNNIKKAFPAKDGWKFSVLRKDSSEVNVSIMSAPSEYGFEGYEQVNHFYIDENFADKPKQAKALNQLHDIIKENHWDKSDSQSDYFHCAFYISINIGKWNKDCVSA